MCRKHVSSMLNTLQHSIPECGSEQVAVKQLKYILCDLPPNGPREDLYTVWVLCANSQILSLLLAKEEPDGPVDDSEENRNAITRRWIAYDQCLVDLPILRVSFGRAFQNMRN
ncbi:hypothetical protein PAAG_04441 [Paracoccidioides lutzii Pb01]|uniref:Uncharacterized protein n=1 Tax=Paracoccidioides lutzii (strain ATCC MYA-826 / Pb01) TaxID=502779 RepID=C1H0Z7_PARBA|nr:hypothetical protein PAAG_04441 [Paracoccidioides lutzii Pb01]EEH33391.2 hypothetical protein PAAG_04441 [Paracoccidioides lutzii Pb01]